MSPRDRSFATAAADGSIVLRHQTSERTSPSFDGAAAPIDQLAIAPRSNGLLAFTGATASNIPRCRNPHPETQLEDALFGKVWYEGYAAA